MHRGLKVTINNTLSATRRVYGVNSQMTRLCNTKQTIDFIEKDCAFLVGVTWQCHINDLIAEEFKEIERPIQKFDPINLNLPEMKSGVS